MYTCKLYSNLNENVCFKLKLNSQTKDVCEIHLQPTHFNIIRLHYFVHQQGGI